MPAEKGGRGKLIRLTSSGVAAQRAALDLIASLEQKWRTRYGANIFNSLRDSLEKIAGNGSAAILSTFSGLRSVSRWMARDGSACVNAAAISDGACTAADIPTEAESEFASQSNAKIRAPRACSFENMLRAGIER